MKKSLNVNEIRPKKLMKKSEKLFKKDLEKFLRKNLMKILCPTCNNKESKVLFKKYDFKFVQCLKCKMIFVNPRPNPKSLENFYKNSEYIEFWNKIFKTSEKIRIQQIFKPRFKLIKKILFQNNIKNCKKLIEVGSGFGWFCDLAMKNNLSKTIYAIEPAPSFANNLRKIKGINVVESTIENFVESSEISDVDVLVNFELISHLSEPKKFLSSCYKLLKKNGLIIISTPNVKGFDIFLLNEKSDYFDPHFLNYYDPNTMSKSLQSVGFREVNIITPGLMDTQIVIQKVKSGDVKKQNFPFIQFLIENNDEHFTNDFQQLLIKHNLSSHMLVVAKK